MSLPLVELGGEARREAVADLLLQYDTVHDDCQLLQLECARKNSVQ